MRVLALDPGERVGWCVATLQPDDDHRYLLEVTGHGMAYLKEMAIAVHQAVAVEEKYDLVIYEKWILTAKGARVSVGSSMESSQFVGMLRLACWLSGTKCIGQRTSALSTADRSLKCGHPSAAGVQALIDAADAVAHDEGHHGSALRHLWTWFFTEHV